MLEVNNTVYLLWFVREMPDGEEDIELLIGVYASDSDARKAIERVKDQRGFKNFPTGFQVCPYRVNQDHWIDGFIID